MEKYLEKKSYKKTRHCQWCILRNLYLFPFWKLRQWASLLLELEWERKTLTQSACCRSMVVEGFSAVPPGIIPCSFSDPSILNRLVHLLWNTVASLVYTKDDWLHPPVAGGVLSPPLLWPCVHPNGLTLYALSHWVDKIHVNRNIVAEFQELFSVPLLLWRKWLSWGSHVPPSGGTRWVHGVVSEPHVHNQKVLPLFKNFF